MGNKILEVSFWRKGNLRKINIDVTPELAAKLGASFGCQPQKSKIAVSGIDTPYIEMIKIALISGIYHWGMKYLIWVIHCCLLQKAVPYHKLSGGVT